MKHLLKIAVALLTLSLFSGCYDDSAVNSRIDVIEARVAAMEQMNSDIASLKAIVEGISKGLSVSEVKPLVDGYCIVLSDGTELVIKNGAKGQTGPEGPQGPRGPQGEKGATGDAPIVSVKLDGGAYWWTVNGEWLLDDNGQKVPVSGSAPRLKLENENWFVSYDNGTSWTMLAAASTTASGYFSSVEIKSTSVIFNLLDGTSFEMPLGNGFSLSVAEDVPCLPDAVTGVPYVVTGAEDAEIYTLADGGYLSSIEKLTATTGNVLITAPAGGADGQILVFASNGMKTLMKCIAVSKGVMNVTEAYKYAAEAATYEIPVQTNMTYTATTAEDWITILDTKAALRDETIRFSLSENPAGALQRTGNIDLVGEDGRTIKSITILQTGDVTVKITKTYYVTLGAQTIDPGVDIADWASSQIVSNDDWITVNPTTRQLEIAANTGLVRSGSVKYGNNFISVIQNPGRSFLDISFEAADGDLATKNTKVVNVGSKSDLTTYFFAFKGTDKEYSQPVTVAYDEKIGHKVAKFHNDVNPSSYGSYLWRNSNGTTVESMYDGFTIELFLTYNLNLWAGGKDSENNAFCYKASTDANGYKAFSMGLIGNEDGVPVFTAILKNSRFKSEVSPKDGEYTHFVFTYDKAAQCDYLYVNGELVAQKSETRNMADVMTVGTQTTWFGAFGTSVSNPWIIGAYMNNQYQTANSCWNGDIAVCRVYSETLTPAEIAQSCNILNSGVRQ